ncbi:MAG TPA: DUF3160 domain-containing protein, partial [Gemmatimonadales bacterium]|nr:DUF3160 domain-containing protein [Gemmatimonadales bacterium]
APPGSQLWATKRLQTGLASWATIREATILVSERADAAEMGEGGFEYLDEETPRGYVEPAPKTFDAIAGLYDALREQVEGMDDLQLAPGEESMWRDHSLRDGIAARLRESAEEARHYADMARRELRGEALTEEEYKQIQGVGGSAEHMFQLYKSLSNPDLALSVPDPMPKIADVQGDLDSGVTEVAVGAPIEWHQIVPLFGRREIAIGSVYSYYEFISRELYDNERWRKELPQRAHPAWVQPYMATAGRVCPANPTH